MTTHLIDEFAKRASQTVIASPSTPAPPRSPTSISATSTAEAALGGHRQDGCVFCSIVAGEEQAHTVYEDEHAIAFLDILPIRPGHLLLLPKKHYARITDLPDDLCAHLGRVLPRLSRALGRALEQPDFNLVSNQGYAQVVPHLHFHLVPAPRFDASPSSSSTSPTTTSSQSRSPAKRALLPLAGREELDDAEAEKTVRRIREELAKEGVLRAKL
ncbi:hypothetical protein JCM10213_005242 [Rhodosporidiobolus nylandii]